jgi:hypothetical protein
MTMPQRPNRFREFVRRSVPGVAAVLIAAAFLYAERIPGLEVPEKGLLLVLPALFVLMVAIVAVGLLHDRGTSLREIVRESITAIALALGAYGHFLIVGGRAARYIILAAAVLLVVTYLREIAHAEREGHDAADVEAFANLSYAMHVLATFFLSAFAFALSGLLQARAWMLALAAGAVIAVLTAETLRRHGIERRRLPSFVYGVLGTELFWAMTVLPTPFVVNAAMCTILIGLGQHVAVRGLRTSEGELTGLRRQVLASAILIAILLLTARWR